jgi:hypothetical protein
VLAVTLWETEEAMHASEEAANQLRKIGKTSAKSRGPARPPEALRGL